MPAQLPPECWLISKRNGGSTCPDSVLKSTRNIQEKNQFFLLRVKELSSNESPYKSLDLPLRDEFDIPIRFIVTRKASLFRKDPSLYKYMRADRSFDFIDPYDIRSQYPLEFRLIKLVLSDNSFEYLVTKETGDGSLY